ncbi:hypothetical protein Sjap_010863 [Stephania japonica]|uniref:Uncharacterized protein n=1 Tax=Stephania japonica TaxID=461633 RepID=A0AAP0P7J4_9MAGN
MGTISLVSSRVGVSPEATGHGKGPCLVYAFDDGGCVWALVEENRDPKAWEVANFGLQNPENSREEERGTRGAEILQKSKEQREDQNPDYEPTELGFFHAVAPHGTVNMWKLEVKGSLLVVDVSKGAGLLNEVKPANKVQSQMVKFSMNLDVYAVSSLIIVEVCHLNLHFNSNLSLKASVKITCNLCDVSCTGEGKAIIRGTLARDVAVVMDYKGVKITCNLCGVSCIGEGEAIIRGTLTSDIAAVMKYKRLKLQEAVD